VKMSKAKVLIQKRKRFQTPCSNPRTSCGFLFMYIAVPNMISPAPMMQNRRALVTLGHTSTYFSQPYRTRYTWATLTIAGMLNAVPTA
jgi:hypothetical protein